MYELLRELSKGSSVVVDRNLYFVANPLKLLNNQNMYCCQCFVNPYKAANIVLEYVSMI